VADVTRVLKDKRLRGDKGGEVAKLFAKHFKVSEHVTYLKRTKIGAAAGTPGRVGKLLCETGKILFCIHCNSKEIEYISQMPFQHPPSRTLSLTLASEMQRSGTC
jgi:hypothetical protein